MDAIFTKIIESSPFVVLILIVGIVFLWRELKEERNKRIEALQTAVELGKAASAALQSLNSNIRRGH